jgi:glutaminase-like protein
MTRRAKRPLDTTAVAKADDAFYAAHLEMVEDGKRIPISTQPNDPCAVLMREEWMDSYVANGGAVDPVSLPAAKPGCTTVPCPVTKKTLTEQEAKQVFNEIAANRNIPFDYPVDCCYSRAHSMCRTMELKGIESEKIWYFDQNWGTSAASSSLKPTKADGNPVTFPAAGGSGRPVGWVYHVAPVIKVVKEDGTTQHMVIDPSLSDRPLTKDEWKKIQGNPPGAYEEVTDSKPYFSNKKNKVRVEDSDMRETCVQLEIHKRDRNAALRAAAKDR